MGKAKLKEGRKPVSGIYCGARYVVSAQGEQLIYGLSLPDDEQVRKNAAARAERIIGECVSDIQERMHNEGEAVEQYRAIRARVRRDYRRCCELIPDNGKLRRAIVDGYFQDLRKRPSKSKGYTGLTLDLTPI